MIPGGKHRPILSMRSRRSEKGHALRLAIASWRELDIHTHVLERGRTVCVTGRCAELPSTTSEEERRLGGNPT